MRRIIFVMLLITCVQFIASTSLCADVDAEKQPVDRMLVLAMDVSHSVNDERFVLQLKGYADAFRDSQTIRTITSGHHGAVAITMAQWSGWGAFTPTVPWMVIRNNADGNRFADAIERSVRLYAEATSISWAILASTKLIHEAPYRASRSIIDISGDGPDDTDYIANMESLSPLAQKYIHDLKQKYLKQAGTDTFISLPEARSMACGAGIEINGLAIEGSDDVPDIASYYRKHVICRKGAFVVRVENPDSYDEFSQAIMRKIRHELSF